MYARVSSDLQQKERSIDSQIAELKKQIERNGDEVVKEYIDDGYSGALLDRPAMNELRSDLKTNIFETIYILNTDRIARDVTYQNIIVGEMLRYKKQIIINGKDYIHNPENKFTLTVLGAVAELERAKLIERVRRGALHRLRQGHLLGNGHHIYGYKYTKKKDGVFPSYAINETEAKVVRHIYEKYLKEEIGYKAMSRHLDEIHAERRDETNWSVGQIKSILQNETYTGMKSFNKYQIEKNPTTGVKRQFKRERSEWINLTIPTVIDTKLFHAVQQKIKYNYDCFRNPARTYLFSRLVYCGKCENRCFAFRRYYKVKRMRKTVLYQRASYKCRVCKNPEINTGVLESVGHEMVQDSLLNPVELIKHFHTLKGRRSGVPLKTTLKKICLEIKNFEEKQQRITELYESHSIDQKVYAEQLKSCDTSKLAEQKGKLLTDSLVSDNHDALERAVQKYCTELSQVFDMSREFYVTNIQKIHHQKNQLNDQVVISGFIPVLIDKETIEVEWRLERRINRAEVAKRVVQTPPQATQINKKVYGGLLATNIKEI